MGNCRLFPTASAPAATMPSDRPKHFSQVPFLLAGGLPVILTLATIGYKVLEVLDAKECVPLPLLMILKLHETH